VLPHAIGTSKHDVPHPQGHDAVDVAGILHAFADPVADQQQVPSYAIPLAPFTQHELDARAAAR